MDILYCNLEWRKKFIFPLDIFLILLIIRLKFISQNVDGEGTARLFFREFRKRCKRNKTAADVTAPECCRKAILREGVPCDCVKVSK